jgi:hypothetical protein
VQKAIWSLAGLGLIILLYVFWRGEERAKGAAQIISAQLLQENKALKDTIKHDEATLQHHDTVVVFKQVVHTDTVLQHLITQSIQEKHDTVVVTREVLIEAKAALDSTKQVADACCKLAHDYKIQWQHTDSLNQIFRRQIPSPAKPWIDRAAGFLTCGAVAWIARK